MGLFAGDPWPPNWWQPAWTVPVTVTVPAPPQCYTPIITEADIRRIVVEEIAKAISSKNLQES